MRDASFYVQGLLDLPAVRDPEERRARWRQSMAALAQATLDQTVAPLDGLHPESLLATAKAALGAGLVDDLDWLAPAAAGAALYELASALPPSPEQREVGRRVASRLLEGTAETFVGIATRLAYGTTRGLGAPGVRPRMALVTELPLNVGVADGRLCLALATRRELAREWVAVPATGSLPSRRLAARILERAASEASKQASLGDQHAVRALASESVRKVMRLLLADRESLVWRHVAVARGLLAPFDEELQKEMRDALSGPRRATAGRRAAASYAALAALDPTSALKQIRQGLASSAFGDDAGVYAALVWGIARAADTEAEAAAEIVGLALPRAPKEVASAVVELRRELGGGLFIEEIADKVLREVARLQPMSGDDGDAALLRELVRDLQGTPRDDRPVRDQLWSALHTYATAGARDAYAESRRVLDAVAGAVGALAGVSREDEGDPGRSGSMARRTAFAVLRDVDEALLQRSMLADLLRLGTADHARGHDETMETVRQRLSDWLLGREAQPLIAPAGAPRSASGLFTPAHPTLRMHRLRTLLHLVDSEQGDGNEDGPHLARMRNRTLAIVRPLISRFEQDSPSVLRRALIACLGRGIDGLVRVGAWDVTDVALVLARNATDPTEVRMISEAAMHPDVDHVLSRYATFLAGCAQDSKVETQLAALSGLAKDFSPDGSARAEALRTTLVRLHSSLQAITQVRSLRALLPTEGGADVLATLEGSLLSLAQLSAGARSRLEARPSSTGGASGAHANQSLTVAVGRVLSGALPALNETLVRACIDELCAGVPRAIAAIVAMVLRRLPELPVDRPSDPAESASFQVTEQLPPWLPARRTLGGFYVLKGLGSGAVSSVFVATRLEDKNEPDAERFALKVPEFSATAARSVSESEFLTMFRAEASALMALPPHKHLARFVTFDAGARPKPILVMELVEGVSFQHVIETGALDTEKACKVLREVLDGLIAMHAVEIGHLDLKPSNVVLRGGGEAVLVDFGLAGRHIRPGCTTGPYGAPEIWGVVPPDVKPTPMTADVYAFGCLAFEALTGRTLFAAESETVQIGMHIAHDGQPPAVKALAAKKPYAELVELLRVCLRRNPKERATAPQVRTMFANVERSLAGLPWPLAAS